MTEDRQVRGFPIFLLIWFGQLISLIGSELTGFALGVWVYQHTGSVTQFALISLFTALPGIVFSPIAGALVDRWDRRWAMILSDAGSGLCTLGMALLLWAGKLVPWHIYIAMGVSSTFSAFQWPAYNAAVTLLVPKKHFGRASGMTQFGQAAAQIIAPVTAGTLMGVIGVWGIMLIDVATFLFAVATLLPIHVPRPKVSAAGEESRGNLLREAAYGWRYITARPGLLGLLLLFVANNFSISVAQVLFTPLVLSFGTAVTLGTVMSIAGVGFLSGGLLMSVWGGPRRRIAGIYVSSLMSALALMAAGLPPSLVVLTTAAFIVFFCLALINSCSQAIWMSKTEPDVQGRVFATRRMIAWSSIPIAYLLAGPLADKVFEPLMAANGALADSVGHLIGVGPGRGVALLYIVLGLFSLGALGAAVLYPRLRRGEVELPDVVGA